MKLSSPIKSPYDLIASSKPHLNFVEDTFGPQQFGFHYGQKSLANTPWIFFCFFFFSYLFWDKIWHNSGQFRIYYVTKGGLDLFNLLPPTLWCWDFRPKPPRATWFLGFKTVCPYTWTTEQVTLTGVVLLPYPPEFWGVDPDIQLYFMSCFQLWRSCLSPWRFHP